MRSLKFLKSLVLLVFIIFTLKYFEIVDIKVGKRIKWTKNDVCLNETLELKLQRLPNAIIIGSPKCGINIRLSKSYSSELNLLCEKERVD